jgi:hypothetical protein
MVVVVTVDAPADGRDIRRLLMAAIVQSGRTLEQVCAAAVESYLDGAALRAALVGERDLSQLQVDVVLGVLGLPVTYLADH